MLDPRLTELSSIEARKQSFYENYPMQPVAVHHEEEVHDTDINLLDSDENLNVNMAVWKPKPKDEELELQV